MIKLSICIPTYNRAFYLDKLLNSLVQNIKGIENNIEIVVSDNNSDDSTHEVVKKYKKIINLRYSKNSINIGGPKNVAKVMGLAKGEYIWLLSDDDIIAEDSIQYLLDFLLMNHDVKYLFYPRIPLQENADYTKMQPHVSRDMIFSDGKSLFNYDEQIPGILGFISSTIIKNDIWKEGFKISAKLSENEWRHLITILAAIIDKKCAILGRVGVYVRLSVTWRYTNIYTKNWFDDYIITFLFAKKLGYSKAVCERLIKTIIRTFSKYFVIDKAKGIRNDNIHTCLSKLNCSNLTVKVFPWYYLSFCPTRLLSFLYIIFYYFKRIKSS